MSPPIPYTEKNQIKAPIVSPMLKVPYHIHPQLSEALSIVSSHDFPLSWSSLLPSSSPTFALPPTIPSSTASSAPPTPSCSSSTTPPTPSPSASTSSTASMASPPPPPLPEVFIKATQFFSANATASSPDILCPFFECQRLSCRIFHSLNSIELSEFFDNPMREWMT